MPLPKPAEFPEGAPLERLDAERQRRMTSAQAMGYGGVATGSGLAGAGLANLKVAGTDIGQAGLSAAQAKTRRKSPEVAQQIGRLRDAGKWARANRATTLAGVAGLTGLSGVAGIAGRHKQNEEQGMSQEIGRLRAGERYAATRRSVQKNMGLRTVLMATDYDLTSPRTRKAIAFVDRNQKKIAGAAAASTGAGVGGVVANERVQRSRQRRQLERMAKASPKLITAGRHGKNGIPRPPKPKPGGIEGKILLPDEDGYHGRPQNLAAAAADNISRYRRDSANNKYREGLTALAAGGTFAAGGTAVGAGYWYKGRRDKAALRRKHGLDPVQKKLKIKMPKFEAPSNHVLGEHVDPHSGSIRAARLNRKGIPAVTSMPPKKTTRERVAGFSSDYPDVPMVAGSLLGTAATTAGVMSWSKDNRRAKGQVAAHKRRQNQMKAKKQAMSKSDQRRRRPDAVTTGLLGAGTTAIGGGVLSNRITYRVNDSHRNKIDARLSALNGAHGADAYGNPVQKLPVPSRPSAKKSGKQMAQAMARAATDEERARIREQMKPKAHPNSATNKANYQRKLNLGEQLRASRNVPRISDAARNKGRYAAFAGGTAALWAAGRRNATVEKYSRRDADAATAGAVGGVIAYQMPGHIAGSLERKKHYPTIADDPRLKDIRTKHRERHKIPLNAEKDHPNWHKYHTTYPKQLPGSKAHRLMARTHTGVTGIALTGAAGVAAAAGSVKASRRKDGVRKNLYVRERRTNPARVVQFGAGAGLVAAGLGRSGVVGRALGHGIKMATTKGNVQAVEALQRAQAARGVLRAGVRPAEHHLRQIRQVDRAVRAVPAPLRGDVALGAGLLLTANSFPMRQTTYRQTGYPATIRRY